MIDDLLNAVVLVMTAVVLVIPLAATVSCAFLWFVFSTDPKRPRSWLLFMLATGASVIDAASLVIAYLVSRRLAGLPPITGPMGAILTGIAIVTIELIPIYYAIRVAKIRGWLK